MLAIENKVPVVASAPSNPMGIPAPSARRTSQDNPTDLSVEKVQEVFLQVYQEEIKTFDPKKKDTVESQMIQRSKAGFTRSKGSSVDNVTNFDIKFSVTLSPEDKKAYKKTHQEEIGFFNFTFTVYKKPDGKFFKISYFSEINLEDKFQAYGLASVIINTYSKTLNKLDTNIDYLHVKSKNKDTASIYVRKNYAFTPFAVQLLEANYGGLTNYLRDSSVSYYNADTIEMFRAVDGQTAVPHSITDLEKALENS